MPAAHWLSDVQGMHAPVVVLHIGPTKEVEQSKLLAQDAHTPDKHIPVRQTKSLVHAAHTPLTQ
jgi:hypothetical protein